VITRTRQAPFSHFLLQFLQEDQKVLLFRLERIEHSYAAINSSVEYHIWFLLVHATRLDSSHYLPYIKINQRIHHKTSLL
jgi:hypothetical protein